MARPIWIGIAVAATAALFAIGWRVGTVVAPAPQFPTLKCYSIPKGNNAAAQVNVQSLQFGAAGTAVQVSEFFCGPVGKTLPKGRNPAQVQRGDHLHCYEITSKVTAGPIFLTDQFANAAALNAGTGIYLCEPADKLIADTPGKPSQ